MVFYSFTPYLIDANGEQNIIIEDISSEYMEHILNWYKNQMSSIQLYSDPSRNYIISNICIQNGKISFEVNQPFRPYYDIESFIDPDDDGNHPIMLDGIEYLVSGKISYET